MVMADDDSNMPIQEVLSIAIWVADRVLKSAGEAESFEDENSVLRRQVMELSQHLRSAARLTSSGTVYDRPIRRVSVELTKTLERSLNLARKCRHKRTTVLHHVLSMTTAADFKKVSALLDSSLADMKWVLSIFSQDRDNDSSVTLPPIASSYPILAWVWSYIAAVHTGRVDAAHELAGLARNNDKNKKIILQEIGIPPLLKMLKETGNVDAQGAAATALFNLADDPDCVAAIVEASGVQIIVNALTEVPMSVQGTLVTLISRMLELNSEGREEFGKENATRILVSLLGMDVDLEEFKEVNALKPVNSLESLVEINKQMMEKGLNCSVGRLHKVKEAESSPQMKLTLKTSCAEALWRLASGSLSNSKKITETKALLVLAKIIEKETDLLKRNCLLVVMELAAVAERNPELKRAVFKPNSTAAKAVLDQLLLVINEEMDPTFVNPAIKAVGCLASMFSAKDKRIVKSLVVQLGHRNPEVAGESAKALCKFVHEKNYNCREHSLAIIEFDGVRKLMKLIKVKDPRGRLHELVLLCNLATNAGNSAALEQAKELSEVLEVAARQTVNLALKELFTKAMQSLTIYQPGAHMHRQV